MEKFQIELKFKSITARWFLNIFTLVAIFVTFAAVASSIIFNSIYTERIEVLADDYSYEFYSLTGANKTNFVDSAVTLAGNFQHKTKLEVQVIDHKNDVIVSTSGFEMVQKAMPDYIKAMETGKPQTFKSQTDTGETVLACTTPIYDSEGEFLGSYRWITSLKAVNKLTIGFVIGCSVVALTILIIFGFTGLYFIRSIVKPITDVSNTARKIAMGDFDSKIEFNRNDEIGELCDTINYMAAELTEAQTLKNDFISSVSHELRTPLTAIKGWGETAKMSLGTDEELVKRGLDVVLTEADRLSSLVEELLDFSRIETGRLSLITQPLNVTQTLCESADMYAELARKNGIEFVFNRPTEQLEVLGDNNRLKQVFINIIDNAVKYTESGGQILINQLREEGCVRISVVDTGVGIPAADIDRVKEKFYKANKTVRGSGIGLALADEIIKQHQGLLFIESTEGAGTTVTIVLPLYEPEEEIEKTEEIAENEAVSENQENKETLENIPTQEPSPDEQIINEILNNKEQ